VSKLIDINNLKREDKIHRLILDVSKKHQIISQYQQPSILTDDELYVLFNEIVDDIYQITEMPKFEILEKVFEDGRHKLMARSISCLSIKTDSIESLVQEVKKMTEDKYCIFYNIEKYKEYGIQEKTFYHFRSAFNQDKARKRNKVIRNILGE